MDLDDLLPKSRKAPSNTIFVYADGCSNIFYITKDQIVYDPMSPMMSNTGTYSGGSPNEKIIDKSAFEAVTALFEQAALDQDNHLKNRPKGSGTISFKNTGLSYVLSMHAESKNKLEALLRKLVDRSL